MDILYGIPAHICQPVRLKILEIKFPLTLTSHRSKAKIVTYSSSAQQAPTHKPHERKSITTITTITITTATTASPQI
mgnify:CR=1 FL=1